MPRAYDTDEQRRADVPGVLVFTQLVDCPQPDCGETFEAVFTDDSMDAEDMAEPPRATLTCPACGHVFEATYEGWSSYGEV